MKDLFLSEWRRFHRLALLFAACHALALWSLSRLTNLIQLGYEEHAALLVVYMLLGLALAFVQIGSYRKPSQWLWLLHRPLPPARIFAALALAALALLALAVLLPLLLFLLATDLLTTHVVDSRHYVALLHLLAFAAMAWLAGVHALTSRHKAAILVLAVPVVLALHLASVWWLLLPVGVCLAWLTFITLHGFRADRAATIPGHGVLLLTALPLQLVFFLLLFQLSKATLEVGGMLASGPASKTVLATDEGVENMLQKMARDSLMAGLADSTDPRASSWRQQLPLLDVSEIAVDIERFPVRHQLGNLATYWSDDERGIEWTFSHDRMQFHGRDPRSGADRGWWGSGGAGSATAFVQVPIHEVTRNVLYAIDEREQRQIEALRLPEGEWFTARPKRALDRLLVLTNRRLIALRLPRDAQAAFAPPTLDWQVPLPAGAEHLAHVNLVPLMDGWLVSTFHYPGREFAGFEGLVTPWQVVLFVGDDGTSTRVGGRADLRGTNVSVLGAPSVPIASWWVSPVLHVLARWPETAIDDGRTFRPRLELLPDVPLFRRLAPALLLVSLALAAWWLRGARVGVVRRRVWLARCALLGLPALVSLVCLEPRLPPRQA